MVSSSDDRRGWADVVSSEPKADHGITDEKDHTASDPEKLQQQGDGQTTQIDPDVAKRIAANVEDFMVSTTALEKIRARANSSLTLTRDWCGRRTKRTKESAI